MTETLANKADSCRGGYRRSHASKLSSFVHRPQTGNCPRKLAALSGASDSQLPGGAYFCSGDR